MHSFLKYMVLGAVFGSLMSYGSITRGAVESTDAVINILVPVAITENQDLQFGNISKPSSGTFEITISTSGAITGGGTHTGGQILAGGTTQQATYTVTASAAENIEISAVQGTVPTGITLPTFEGTYNGSADTTIDTAQTFTSVASGSLAVGGRMDITSSASTGSNTATFNLTVEYQ